MLVPLVVYQLQLLLLSEVMHSVVIPKVYQHLLLITHSQGLQVEELL